MGSGNSTTKQPPNFLSPEEQILEFSKKITNHLSETQIKAAIKYLKEKQYQVVQFLGIGAFGIVIEVTNDAEKSFAVKIIAQSQVSEIKQCLKEVKNSHKKVKDSEHVLTLQDYYLDKDGLGYMITEICRKGSLSQYLQTFKDITESQVKDLFIQILQGIIDIHSKDLVHSDIKPANILVTDEGQLKIKDLGIFKVLRNHLTHRKQDNNQSYLYRSAEFLKGEPKQESDIFSIGAVLFEICNPNLSPLLYGLKYNFDKLPETLRFPELTKIALSMMEHDPSKRALPQNVLNRLLLKHQGQLPPLEHTPILNDIINNDNCLELSGNDKIENASKIINENLTLSMGRLKKKLEDNMEELNNYTVKTN